MAAISSNVRLFMEKIENRRVFLNYVRRVVEQSVISSGIWFKFYRKMIAKHIAINNYFVTHCDGTLFSVSTVSSPPGFRL